MRRKKGAAVDMNADKVDSYILGTITLDHKRSVDAFLRYQRNVSVFLSLTFFGFAVIGGVFANYANTITNMWVVLIALSIPINIVWSLRIFKREFASWKADETGNHPKVSRSEAGKIFAVIGGVVIGPSLVRVFLADASQDVLITVGLVLSSILTVWVTHLFCGYYYKFRLLKKYCPHLVECRG